jgi:membrane-bound inhibitor of C-type lysozyme
MRPVYTWLFRGASMNRRNSIVIGAALWVVAAGASPALAQTIWQTYSCGDGSQFIVGFFQYDKRAHMQIDGKSVTLNRRLALSGSRYSGRGVTLTVGRTGTRLKHGKRPVTACEII